MSKRFPKLISLTAALAALSGTAAIDSASAATNMNGPDQADPVKIGPSRGEPNVFMSVGKDLLGLIVTKRADGTVVADHSSHESHSSHSSHRSHYSSII